MKRKIYFSGSISGGRQDAALYARIIALMQQTDIVLTEHVGDVNYSTKGRSVSDEQAIYEQDTAWLRASDLVIAECTQPSLGVGYELALAEQLGKPVYVFHRRDRHLSAMIAGDPYFHVFAYETEDELLTLIAEILKNGNDSTT